MRCESWLMEMNRIEIEHISPPSDTKRIYSTLAEMDMYMIPPISERTDLQTYAKKLANNADIFYARCKDKDCGHCAIYMNQIDKAYISSFGILPEFQNRGIATKLINYAIYELELRGIKEVELEVWKENMKAYRLYAKVGFEELMEGKGFIKMKKNLVE